MGLHVRVGVDVTKHLVALVVPDQDVGEGGALELLVVLRHLRRCCEWVRGPLPGKVLIIKELV